MLGTVIGNYQIKSLIGEGGMGKVYLAEHPGLERKSAIKVLHAYLATDPQVVSRFFTEARAANAIRHPNIVEIYDYGTLPDGAPYIVMEYLEGETLSARIARGPLALSEAIEYACQAASALAAAHDKEIVHRDLKPDNLLLTKDIRLNSQAETLARARRISSGGALSAPQPVIAETHVKILDFGIAKLQHKLEGQAHRTRTGVLMGTPLYMSPEQCLGIKDVDARSDIYSLGCIVFEMVCGRPPFDSEAVGALISMHINDPPPTPRSIAPALPVALDIAITRTLAKLPEHRWATMHAFLAELEALRATIEKTNTGGLVPPPRQAMAAQETKVAVLTTLSAAGATAGVVAGQTLRIRGRKRWFVSAAIVGVVAIGGILVLGRHPGPPVTAAVTPERSATSTSHAGPRGIQGSGAPPAARAAGAAPPAAAAATDSPARAEAAARLSLDSDPPGATVLVDGVVVGTTAMVYRAAPGSGPHEFAFVLGGYQPETIKAVPSDGMTLKPTLKKSAAPTTRTHARTRATRPPNDIKSER